MVSSTRTCTAIASWVLISAFGTACADAPHGEIDESGSAVQELSFAESGNVLFELKTSEGDFVTFYEFADGSVAAVGRLNENADHGLRALIERASSGGDLSELYRTLAADRADSEVVARLAELDRLSSTPSSDDIDVSLPNELGARTTSGGGSRRRRATHLWTSWP
jgi:hypothetical protein